VVEPSVNGSGFRIPLVIHVVQKPDGENASTLNVSLVPVLAPGASPPKALVLTIGQIRLEGSAP
jgi:hypothetical protein